MRLIDATVAISYEVMPGTHRLRLVAPGIARDAVPGQFVHVKCGQTTDPLLRRPISLAAIGKPLRHRTTSVVGSVNPAYPSSHTSSNVLDINDGEIDLLFAEVGQGTRLLAGLAPGDSVNLLGPLGAGFRLHSRTRNVLLVAGGIGLAPLAALAVEAVRQELVVTMLYGARSADAALPPWLLPPEVEYVVCTEDGSVGRKGLVTDFVADFIDWADEVCACGPRPMLASLAENQSLRRKPVQVSLEERMACGVGACLGCVVRTRNGRKRVCKDGPVFELRDVLWE